MGGLTGVGDGVAFRVYDTHARTRVAISEIMVVRDCVQAWVVPTNEF